jgi:aryl-alcohol dehydrogenase-like predicted oxidoreductase
MVSNSSSGFRRLGWNVLGDAMWVMCGVVSLWTVPGLSFRRRRNDSNQTEYSLWSRDVEPEILPACRTLGIALVAYSPLGRGSLTGTIRSSDKLAPDGLRKTNLRYQGENLERNLALIKPIEEMATDPL